MEGLLVGALQRIIRNFRAPVVPGSGRLGAAAFSTVGVKPGLSAGLVHGIIGVLSDPEIEQY